MVCLSCARATAGRLCPACAATLRPAPDRLLPGGLRVVASFSHEGAARRMVHLLKYGGVLVYAEISAERLAGRLPELPLIPIPRAVSRRVRYGVDPALIIARAISRRTGQPVVRALAPRLHTTRRAGGEHPSASGRFRLRRAVQGPSILVDDVLTTGATILEAANSIGGEQVRMAVVANAVPEVSSLSLS